MYHLLFYAIGAGAWFRQGRLSAAYCFLLIVFLLAFYAVLHRPSHPQEELVGAVGSRASKRQFEFINRGVMEFDVEARSIMQSLVKRRASSRDPQLIKLVERLLDPPPTEGTLTLSKGILDTPQSKEVDALLSQQVSPVIRTRSTSIGFPTVNPQAAKGGWFPPHTFFCITDLLHME